MILRDPANSGPLVPAADRSVARLTSANRPLPALQAEHILTRSKVAPQALVDCGSIDPGGPATPGGRLHGWRSHCFADSIEGL